MSRSDNPTPVLAVRGLHRFYLSGDEEVAALKDVSIQFERGEFVAIVGPSGSGKSTLLQLMAALDNPDGGSVWLYGHRISHRTRAEQSAQRGASIGLLTQSSGLLEHLSALQNVELAWRLRMQARRKVGMRKVSNDAPHAMRASFLTDSAALLREVGLAARANARPSTLSGGETARANLAVALAAGPDVLLADEPTAEVSRPEERAILTLISASRPPDGVTVVVTHSDAVAQAADRVVELAHGVMQ